VAKKNTRNKNHVYNLYIHGLLLMTVLFSLLLCHSCSKVRKVSDNELSNLKAGAAEVIITPPAKGTILVGPLLDPSTGIHDDLYARALVFEQGKKKFAFVTMDLLGLDFTFNDRILNEVSKQSGIPESRIMLHCTHNHSAPITIPWNEWEKSMDSPWHKQLPGKIASVVKYAAAHMQNVKLRFGREPVTVACNRRLPTNTSERAIIAPNPDGPIVPWVDVLRVDNFDDKPVAILISYAAHPVVVHSTSTLITADYPGFAVETIRKSVGGNTIVMFAQGCGGDINADTLRGGMEKAQATGEKLGQAALEVVREDLPAQTGELDDVSHKFSLPLQKPPSVVECQKALAGFEEIYNKLLAKKDPNNARELYYRRTIVDHAREVLEMSRKGETRSLRFQVQAFALSDDLCIIGLPHEMLCEYQLWVNETSPFKNNMVFGYTNGCESYIGTIKSYALGGYETGAFPQTSAALAYHNRLAPDPNVETQIKAAITGALRELKSNHEVIHHNSL
jgi:neutral ceramidase